MILTNDGGLARVLELPDTGWLRRYRVRAFGSVREADLARLAEGVAVDGILYGPIEASIDQSNGPNMWLTIGLREGKNREVKNVMSHIGLTVNRLIRISFGPFQLGDLAAGEVREVRPRVLKDQLGEKLISTSGATFDDERTSARAAREQQPKPEPKNTSKSRPPGQRRTSHRSQFQDPGAGPHQNQKKPRGSKPSGGPSGGRKNPKGRS